MSDELELGSEVPAPTRRRIGYFDVAHHGPVVAGSQVVLSPAAYQAHLWAIADSFAAGTPGVISADYVAQRVPDAAVREVLAAGLWERTDSGFAIEDQGALSMVGAMYDFAGQVAASCLTGAGHVPEPSNPGFCSVCHGPIEEPPDAAL